MLRNASSATLKRLKTSKRFVESCLTSVAQRMTLIIPVLSLIPVEAIHLRAGHDDSCGSLPNQNIP